MSATGSAGAAAGLRVGGGAETLRPDRLELGEGIRWTDRGIVLVDILAGRLLTADGATMYLHDSDRGVIRRY
ncbi:hypothetical protein ACFWXN_15550, partial [Streptomyces sp. NPDC058694]